MMLSLPEDWNYTTRGLAKICKEGVDAHRRGAAGAGKRRVHHPPPDAGPTGAAISDTEYVIYEQPQPKASDTPQPDYGFTRYGKPVSGWARIRKSRQN